MVCALARSGRCFARALCGAVPSSLRRLRSFELPDDEFIELAGDQALCYELKAANSGEAAFRDANHGARALVLIFQWESDCCLAAEAVEALVFLAARMRRAGGGTRDLNSVFDTDARPRLLRDFTQRLGSLQGVNADGTLVVAAAVPSSVASSPDLATPMRSLAVADVS